MSHVQWSHSSLKMFETCARQYHELRVLKKWPKEEGEQAIYGTLLHETCERYIKNDVALPPQFSFMQGALDALKSKPGTKYCEHEMALTWELKPCSMEDENVWVRGIADLIIVDEPNYTAWVLDYKTGNDRYADTDQLTLMALLVFANFPKIKHVKGALLFVLKNTFFKHNLGRRDRHTHWWKYRERTAAIEHARDADNWNPKPSGLCKKHCAVLTCEHNGRG